MTDAATAEGARARPLAAFTNPFLGTAAVGLPRDTSSCSRWHRVVVALFVGLLEQLALASVPLACDLDKRGLRTGRYRPAAGLADIEVAEDGPDLVTLSLCDDGVVFECYQTPKKSVRPLAELLVSVVVNGARVSQHGNFVWFDSVLDDGTVRFPPPRFGTRHEPTAVDHFGGSIGRDAVAEWVKYWVRVPPAL